MAADSGAPLAEALSGERDAPIGRSPERRALRRRPASEHAQREVRASDVRLAGAVDAVARRPVLIAAAPARSPAPEVNSASAPGWLLPAIVLSALLVGGLVTLALRRPGPRPPSPAAGARRAAGRAPFARGRALGRATHAAAG